MSLQLEPNFHQPGRQDIHPYTPGDEFYEALIAAHNGLDDEQSARLNSALILLLANHIGNLDTLRQALTHARQTVTQAAAPSATPNS